jgi:hypothetical protein
MASVAKQVLISTKTGQRGTDAKKATSFNQRQDNFVIFTKLEGEPVKPIGVKFATSPNGKDWKQLGEVELKKDGELLFHDVKDYMLAHFMVSYDESALKKVTGKGKSKEVEYVADLHVEICYRDVK